MCLPKGGRKGVTEMTTEGMQDPFSRFVRDFPEMYEVVRTILVVRHRRLYKVEVLKNHTAFASFKVHFSLQERLPVKPIDSKSEENFKKIWVDLTLPWVETEDADSALNQALLQLSQITP
jgi:hypothetical protein